MAWGYWSTFSLRPRLDGSGQAPARPGNGYLPNSGTGCPLEAGCGCQCQCQMSPEPAPRTGCRPRGAPPPAPPPPAASQSSGRLCCPPPPPHERTCCGPPPPERHPPYCGPSELDRQPAACCGPAELDRAQCCPPPPPIAQERQCFERPRAMPPPPPPRLLPARTTEDGTLHLYQSRLGGESTQVPPPGTVYPGRPAPSAAAAAAAAAEDGSGRVWLQQLRPAPDCVDSSHGQQRGLYPVRPGTESSGGPDCSAAGGNRPQN